MSKSKKNVVDPTKIIEIYGADTARWFMLSDSPPEKDVQWSEQGIKAAFKFIQKLWLLHNKIKQKISVCAGNNDIKGIKTILNNFIDKRIIFVIWLPIW